MNSRSRVIVALLGALVLAWAFGGCGGGASSSSAKTLLSETFDSKKPIESGQLDASISLSGTGSTSLKQAISVHLSGPFQSAGARKLPSFDLKVELSVGGHILQAGALSTSKAFFIELEGTPFQAPQSAVSALEQAYAKASTSAASHGSSTFATLGIDPGRWLVNPVQQGVATVDGTETIHLVADLDIARFLADANRLSGAGSSLGLNGGGNELGGLISTSEIDALAHAVKSARVDVYTGKEDHLLRRITVTASLDAGGQAAGLLEGLRTAKLTLDLQLTDVNQHQTIEEPSKPRAMSELVTVLQQIGVLSHNTAGGSSGSSSSSESAGEGAGSAEDSESSQTAESTSTATTGSSQASESTSGSSSQTASSAYLECEKKAGQSVEALQRCASLLNG